MRDRLYSVAAMALNRPDQALLDRLAERLGPKGFTADSHDLAPWLGDWRGWARGEAAALLSPASTAEVADVVRMAAEARVALVPQGGNTSMVAGAIPPAEGGAAVAAPDARDPRPFGRG
jgi:FAD/FMN-containing dehydrogenase